MGQLILTPRVASLLPGIVVVVSELSGLLADGQPVGVVLGLGPARLGRVEADHGQPEPGLLPRGDVVLGGIEDLVTSLQIHLELVLPDVVELKSLVEPLEVDPHHDPQGHIFHHHVLEAREELVTINKEASDEPVDIEVESDKQRLRLICGVGGWHGHLVGFCGC